MRLAGSPYHPSAAGRPMRTPQARMQVAACTGHAGLQLGNRIGHARLGNCEHMLVCAMHGNGTSRGRAQRKSPCSKALQGNQVTRLKC